MAKNIQVGVDDLIHAQFVAACRRLGKSQRSILLAFVHQCINEGMAASSGPLPPQRIAEEFNEMTKASISSGGKVKEVKFRCRGKVDTAPLDYVKTLIGYDPTIEILEDE